MIRLDTPTLPTPAAPRASLAMSAEAGGFALTLARVQPTRPEARPPDVAVPAQAPLQPAKRGDDRQDLAGTGSDLPQTAAMTPETGSGPDTAAAETDPLPSAAATLPDAATIEARRPVWRFVRQAMADSSSAPTASDPQAASTATEAMADGDAEPQAKADEPDNSDTGADKSLLLAQQMLIAIRVPQSVAARVRPGDARGPTPRTTVAASATPIALQDPSQSGAAPTETRVAQAPAPAQGAPVTAYFAGVDPAPKPDGGAAQPMPNQASSTQPAPQADAAANRMGAPAVAALVPAAVAAALQHQAAPLAPTRAVATDRKRAVDALDGVAAASLGSTGASGAAAPQTVQPASGAQQAALDLSRQDWMASMIDRIETLRDADGARTARIRLNPDAMGTVDISVRHGEDGIQVHFASQTAATRTLLGDAAPALAQIAEARGIKLAQASVDGGAGQSANQSANQFGSQPRQARGPSAPVSARADAPETTDDRIA